MSGNELLQSNFEKELKKNFKFLADKKIKILPFALPAGKQPQQYFINSFFLDSIDLVINIDGRNDLVTGENNYFPCEYPLSSEVLFSQNAFNKIDIIGELVVYRKLFAMFTRSWQSLPFSSKSVFLFFVWHQVKKTADQIVLSKITDIKKMEITPTSNKTFCDGRIQSSAGIYERFTLLQGKLLQKMNKPYLFVIQPNQYVLNSKPMGSVEKQIAIDESVAFRTREAYKQLESISSRLRKQNIHSYPLFDIFKNHPEPLYVDRCCHLNFQGNIVMTDAIVKLLKEKNILKQ